MPDGRQRNEEAFNEGEGVLVPTRRGDDLIAQAMVPKLHNLIKF